MNNEINSDAKRKIAELIVNWYRDYVKENQEIEEIFLDEIDVDDSDGRIELILLARLFSQYMLREEKAIGIWKELRKWFLEEGFGYREIFERKNKLGVEKFRHKLSELGFPGNALELALNLELAINRLETPTGEIEFQKKESWKKTVESLADSLRGTGIRQKVFWLFRVLKQTGEWRDIPGEYCCVSDVHVKVFLKKNGFVSDPEEDLFLNSRILWEYFNKPFDGKLYDLPVFRFARNHGCKECRVNECNIRLVENCARKNQKS
jgi:hypothetical protein